MSDQHFIPASNTPFDAYGYARDAYDAGRVDHAVYDDWMSDPALAFSDWKRTHHDNLIRELRERCDWWDANARHVMPVEDIRVVLDRYSTSSPDEDKTRSSDGMA